MPLWGGMDEERTAAPPQDPQNSCTHPRSAQPGFETHIELRSSSDLLRFNHLQYLLGLMETQLQESRELTRFL